MARTSVQRIKATLFCFVLGWVVVPAYAVLGSTADCIMPLSINGPATHSTSRNDACTNALGGNSLTYDSGSARCVQGSGGCEFSVN